MDEKGGGNRNQTSYKSLENETWRELVVRGLPVLRTDLGRPGNWGCGQYHLILSSPMCVYARGRHGGDLEQCQ